MKKKYEELPLMMSVKDISEVLGISVARSYELAKREDFPSFKIGTRIIVSKDKFVEWVEKQSDIKN